MSSDALRFLPTVPCLNIEFSTFHSHYHAKINRLPSYSTCREPARSLDGYNRTPQYQRKQLPHFSHPSPHTPNPTCGGFARPDPDMVFHAPYGCYEPFHGRAPVQ